MRWSLMLQQSSTSEDIYQQLKNSGVTHILADWRGLDYFAQFDRAGAHQRGVEFFEKKFAPKYLRSVFRDESSSIYELK